MNQAKKNIKLNDLCFYFDGVQSIRQDQGGLGRKTAQILALRERLLKLSDHEFDAVIGTISKMVDSAAKVERDEEEEAKRRKEQEATQLFTAINESHALQKSVDEVEKI